MGESEKKRFINFNLDKLRQAVALDIACLIFKLNKQNGDAENIVLDAADNKPVDRSSVARLLGKRSIHFELVIPFNPTFGKQFKAYYQTSTAISPIRRSPVTIEFPNPNNPSYQEDEAPLLHRYKIVHRYVAN